MDTQTYKYGFSKPENYTFKAQKGLNHQMVKKISKLKNEPSWMREFRLKAFDIFKKKKLPGWGPDLSKIDFDDIYYYIKPTKGAVKSWEELPVEIRDTYDKIGVPQAEKNFLAGVSAQYECITGDSIIFTNHGAKQIKDLKINMYVYSLNETSRLFEQHKVKGLEYKGVRPVCRLKVAGREISCTRNHPLLALNYEKKIGKQRGKFGVKWKYLHELSPGDYIAIVKNLPDKGKAFKLPKIICESIFTGKNQFGAYSVKYNLLSHGRNKKLRIPIETTEALMWLIGIYLGDGYITKSNKSRDVLSIAIPIDDQETRKKIQGVFKKLFNYDIKGQKEKFRIRVHSTPIITLFKQLDLKKNAYTKTLPEWIFSLPNSQKYALIAGYIDSDGYLRNSKTNSDVWITSVNNSLLRSVQLLAISCGLHTVGIYKFNYKLNSNNDDNRVGIGYRLQIAGDLLPLSDYSIKVRNGFVPRRYYHTYSSHHKSPITLYTSSQIGFAAIQEIVQIGEEDVYDIEVEDSHNFVANGILVHNSEVVYENMHKELTKLGVIFCDMDTALKKYPELVQEYFGKLVPPHDNKFASLNSAVWSGGSFIYIPKNIKIALPLQAYFRINAESFGQFERTLIIVDEGGEVHYIEGCTAPIYSKDSLHAAVVEIFVKKGARMRYTTVQNWSKNVYNLVTKRSRVEEKGIMEWVDCNLGSLITMKYPSILLMGEGAKGEVLSIACASSRQIQDAGAKVFHFAPNTSSRIISKSISKTGGRTSYRGLVQVAPGAKHSSSSINCEALIMDEESRSDTYPLIRIKEKDITVQHEASVRRLDEEKVFYLTSRGIKKEEAEGLLVNGFISPIVKEVPLEYAIELNRLINLEMSGKVG